MIGIFAPHIVVGKLLFYINIIFVIVPLIFGTHSPAACGLKRPLPKKFQAVHKVF